MVFLVVPCFNESQRLNLEAFHKALTDDLHILFVDDGSTDGTVEMLKKSLGSSSNVSILPLSKNGGKAEAVRQGVLHLTKLPTAAKADWWGFWDADLSTPLTEVPQFQLFQKTFSPESTMICGSRLYRLGSHIKRSALRHYLGRGFATIIAHALQIEAYDTQCGAKLFRPSLANKAFGEKFISPWIFDVEILLRVGQSHVVEYPLKTWEDIPGSKVKIAREALRVLRDIFLIRKKYLKS